MPAPFLMLTQEEVERRKAYFEISLADEERVRGLHSRLSEHIGPILERFYEFLLAHSHVRGLLSAPGLVERLKEIQRRYFTELTTGPYDLHYFENRLRVGLAHQRTGLAPEWYLGAYLKYLGLMEEVLRRSLGSGTPEMEAAAQSLTKVVFLDMSLAIDAYILSAQEELAKRAEELERANAELRRLDAAKRHLTGAIVHDLQNPLAGIIAFLQVLGSRPQGLTDAEKRSLSEALARCNDLSTLILDVLQMNRAEEGRLELYLENLDLGEVARHAVEAFTLVAEQSGKRLTYSGPGRPVTLRSDQSLLRRVLYNLVRNALQHTPAGTHVQVRVDPGPPWSVTVCDDGPGIPREIRDRIFEPGALRSAGYQVQSGVGLVFCKRTASALGLNLRLSDEHRRGACFVLEPSE
jgi:signal transduction histidine kinase